jgi:hypothetical protein
MVERICQARRTWGPHRICRWHAKGKCVAGPEPRVKGGRSPARAAPLTRGAGRVRLPMAGCGAVSHPAMQTQAAHLGGTNRACKGSNTARLLRRLIEVTMPGKTRGLVSVSSPSSGPFNSAASRRCCPAADGRRSASCGDVGSERVSGAPAPVAHTVVATAAKDPVIVRGLRPARTDW